MSDNKKQIDEIDAKIESDAIEAARLADEQEQLATMKAITAMDHRSPEYRAAIENYRRTGRAKIAEALAPDRKIGSVEYRKQVERYSRSGRPPQSESHSDLSGQG